MHPLAVSGLIVCLLLIVGADSTGDDNGQCPNKCTCRRSLLRDGSSYIKLRCGDSAKITTLDEIDLLNIASEIIHFNLSGNLLTTFYPKVQMIALQKLDLSQNKLTDLQNNQFSELPNLRRLDISENAIKKIELHAFSNLHSLERLKLNQNQINSITKGTFDHLTNLKQLDISSNPLTCDCGLLWLVGWSSDVSVKLVANPKCASPPTFRGLPIRKLKIGDDIHCRSAASISGIPIIEMTPNVNQVVFEGDSLKLRCKAPNIFDAYYNASSRIDWTWFDSEPKSYFDDVAIESHYLQSTGLIDSILRISKLKRNHTGIWSCLFVSMQGNHSKAITVVVISDDTRYCPITMTSGNKGTYTWPRTVVNYTATVPCESINLNFEAQSQKASYFCSEDGKWENLDTGGCAYVSETTKILEQFSKVNSSIIESAKHFRNYTSNKKHFSDVMDLVFAIDTMENYLKYMSVNQIGGVLMDITDNLMELSKKYLSDANHLYGSCTKLVNITEKLATFTSTSLLHKSNIAVEIFPLKKNGFLGLTCSWYVDSQKSSERLFSCITDSQSDASDLRGKITEASITIPDTLFEQLKEDKDFDPAVKLYNILISMHSNNKLFPVDQAIQDRVDIKSAVVGAKLVEKPVNNLTDPVLIMLRVATNSLTYTPVWWDPSLANGTGNWSSEGCTVDHELSDHVIFTCSHFGYYGLLQETVTEAQVTGAKFKYSHPAIYVGSFVLFTSLLIATVTYLVSYGSIQMPKKSKHSLINMWIAVCCLVYLYVFGIFQTEDQRICQIVGMSLHYFTLSSLLWMCVNVNCTYNRLSKNDVMDLQDDDLGPSDQPVKKPIAGLYFVGWGVAIIVCGISAAINIRDYASSDRCFLRPGPPLSALYIPAAILVTFFGVFCLLIRCTVYNADANGHLSEGTQATENVDLDLLEPNFPHPDNRSVLSSSSKTASSEAEDPEHAPSAQLKANVIFLALYSSSWLCCALATARPFNFLPSFGDDLFAIVYAVMATVTGAFTLFFYCVARSDVRNQWGGLTFWLRNRKPCFVFRSRNVSDTPRNLPQIQIHPLPVPPVGIPLIEVPSRSSSRTSSRTKSNRSATILKGAVDLNCAATSLSDAPSNKNNVNLIVLHRQQYRNAIPNIIENPTSAAEVFYNPHQSTVARKFFKRQKRHMMKRNNLATLRNHAISSDAGSCISDYRPRVNKDNNSSADRSIFGTNSKVNNTNIHVEKVVRRTKTQKNPNLFSDSAEEDSGGDPNLGRLVLEAERLRRREAPVNKHRTRKKFNKSNNPESPITVDNNIMRSVSQQCTLEYSSENLSDSFLDKLSPEKVSNLEEGEAATLPLDEIALPGGSESFRASSAPSSEMLEANPTASEGKIYVNPAHDIYFVAKGTRSRASSVSVSDLDELYQQIRRGPSEGVAHSRTFVGNFRHNSPCLSDSDANDRNRRKMFGDDVETSV